ncbi:MAG TPA: DUF882 domain-containing protein [Pseudolabrys sp.]|nr:DUF882 domain-containing protein [Pseudolabrys sp.]
MLGANDALQNASAEGDTRTLSFHHVHTGEDITITYKRNGRYDDAALKKLDWFMRDWRKEKSTRMDPHLFDLLWETYREVGATQPIDVVCGYRSPETNKMLRNRSSGVAQNSNHITGHAMDFFIPGVSLAKIREVGLRLQRGGVGFYPTSGSPFVHLDTGTVRHWPRMTHDQLVKVFPDGRTVHIPSDGHPLRGYALALADVERRGDMPSEMSLEAAREHGAIGADATGKPKRSLFARLFGRGKDTDEVNEEPAPKSTRAPVAVASVSAPKAKPVSVEHIVPLPTARPKAVAVAAAPTPLKQTAIASLGNKLFDTRGYWHGTVQNSPELPAAVAVNTAYQTASAGPDATGSTALAYAAQSGVPALTRTRPMGSNTGASMESQLSPRQPEAKVMPVQGNTTVVAKPSLSADALTGTRRDSPWLRAAMVTPSVSGYLTATRMGAVDMRPLHGLLHKPSMSVVMRFSADPRLGLASDRFNGPAVVFVATTTFATPSTAAAFSPQTTASLR